MPFITTEFLSYLARLDLDEDAAVPRVGDRLEPLCARYHRRCAEPIRRRLETGSVKITDFLSDVRMKEVGRDELAPYGPHGALFVNINTPEDYAQALDVIQRLHRTAPEPPSQTSQA
jgi:molybdopterin-guanine dinucleotide biosynthesis protein A